MLGSDCQSVRTAQAGASFEEAGGGGAAAGAGQCVSSYGQPDLPPKLPREQRVGQVLEPPSPSGGQKG